MEDALKTLVWYGIFNAVVLCALLLFGLDETSLMPHELILKKPAVLLNPICSYTCLFFALAATSLVFPLVSLSAFISTIFTYGCSNLCVIAEGSGDYERARRLFTLGLFATLLLGLAQSVLFHLMEDLYFGYYTSSPAIEAFAREYYRLFIFVPPVMALATFLDEMISADGDDTLSYVAYLVSFVVNVSASVFLARTMGMSGLALGTALSYVGYLIVVSIHFLKKSNTYRLRYWSSFRDLLRFAQYSLKNNAAGICMSVVSAGFT